MHVAVLDRDKCHPKKCHHECQYYCPPVRNHVMAIDFPDPDGQPLISETLCIGCGICIRRCPFGAIKIVTLPDELNKEVLHRYGVNGFRIYSIPTITPGRVSAILGQNGLGKTTTLNILSGITVPNLGSYDSPPSKEAVINRFARTEMGAYFRGLYEQNKKAVLKNQYVDYIPKVVKGTIGEILKKNDETGRYSDIVTQLNLENSVNKSVTECSGGELQRLAIGTVLEKDADIYLFDEMTSYLDINERLNASRIVQDLARKKTVIVVEHDLAILDWLADSVNIVYGDPGVYGIFSEPLSTNRAINAYLSGFLREENVRIRSYPIEFEEKTSRRDKFTQDLISWTDLKKTLGDFTLDVSAGKIHKSEIVGILGKNALGKSTFIMMLAGVMTPDSGTISQNLRVSYKPQYITTSFDGSVSDLIRTSLGERSEDSFVKNEIFHPLSIEDLMENPVSGLSGGELQRLSIALTLARDADIYLIDEPSAHLDSSFRMVVAKVIRRVMENTKKTAMVVDHDIYLIDLISDSLIVFSGVPGSHGQSEGPMDMRDGMNRFLKIVGVTFRRDQNSRRPRINKENSSLDRMQKEQNNYYYS
ncbi:ribosome biogenesis/translation initiation ATPase RLI [Thermoplasma sp. Kam2015]|uniref:ribosome biogenesis/translation initiation ATPase RLI n=1 Tax=Thermoplasma sp. Kam2015 TaxID=2094122 RepID=UPI000DA0E2B3|nr:ribosome biogenesis/translation initiation ATPase RLI [Thermoplasma sp. Kam2015]PYB67508.1 ribosome biogenesis/translation initiation ATPase RLI [Thermoplasma sp. Kam2015]